MGNPGNRTDSSPSNAQLYLKRDRFRILMAGATGTLNYKFYGLGNSSTSESIAITQSGSGLLTGLLVRTFRRWYVGPRYYYFKVTTGLDGSPQKTDPRPTCEATRWAVTATGEC